MTSPEMIAQVEHIYRRLAREARYRPAAPSDGLGNITVPERELDLDAEATEYAMSWLAEEHGLDYSLGCPDWHDRPALIFAVEAARAICGGNRVLARRLLAMAFEGIA